MGNFRSLLRRKLRAAWRRRWLGVAVAWALCLLGWAYVSSIPNQFEASARLYVDSDAVLTPLLKGLAVDSSGTNELDVLQRTLLSRPNLERLVSKTDLELSVTGPADLEALVIRLANDIRVTPQTRNLFTITYRNQDPRIALDVVQTILTTFIESKIGNNRSDLENAQQFLQAQLDNYERQLREAERKRATFRSKYIDILPAEGANGTGGLEAAKTAVRQLQGQLLDATAKHDALTKELSTTPPLLVTETDAAPGGGGGRVGLAEAERTLAELQLRYTNKHPDVVAARQRVEALRSGAISEPRPAAPAVPATPQAAGRGRSVPNPVYEQLKVRLVENDSLAASLSRQLNDALKENARLEDIARGAPGLQAEAINLNRDYEVVRKNYEELLARREQMRLASAADTDANKIKVQIVDPPQKPQRPVAPKRMLLMTAVLFVGLFGGLGASLLLSEMDASFQSIEDLRELGLPVIGAISVILVTQSIWRRLFRVGSFSTAVLLLCAIYGGLLRRLIEAGST